MSAPELLVKFSVLSQQMMRCLTLDRLHHPARRKIRGHSQQKMHMVWTYVSLHDFDVVASTYFANKVPKPLAYFPSKNRLAVFRNKNKMIVKSMDGV